MTNSSTPSLVYIQHQDDIEKYGPPGHAGTVNRRLCDKGFCDGFEMILGEIVPGGEAARHHHETEHQAMYVLSGNVRVTLADDAPVDCPAGTVLRLPPKLDHHLLSLGPDPLKLMIIYSPPLAPRNDTPVKAD